jgi:ABC-2 type transport system ATP-binding protein
MRQATGIVAADGLCKSYRGGVRALDDLTFSVPAGTIFALLGPNGAGKTTTMRILTTLTRPDSGRATVAGADVLAEPARARLALGAVSQHSGAVGLLTGRENLAMQGSLYGMRGKELRLRVASLLDQFGLADAADRRARTYSGGMRRRLDIATVLVHRPAVLFLDEPTTGLDPQGRADLWAVLTGLATAGMTIVVTTHYLEEADQYAASVAIVDQGRIVAQGTPGELKAGIPAKSVTVTAPSLDDVYLHHAGRSLRQAERIPVS